MAASDLHLQCNCSNIDADNDPNEPLKKNDNSPGAGKINLTVEVQRPQRDESTITCPLLPWQQPSVAVAPGQLLMIRHGQSRANASRELSGWQDTDLTSIGESQARSVAEQLRQRNWSPDVAFCSVLQRALKTCQIICGQLDAASLTPLNNQACRVETSWKLNEQMYGSLMGRTQQRGLLSGPDVRPPPLLRSDPHWPGHEAKYSGVPTDLLPETESCLDAFARVRAYFSSRIAPEVLDGRRVLWVGHGGVFCTFISQTLKRNVHFENCKPYRLVLNADGWPVSIEAWF